MLLVWGSKMYGRVDDVPGLFYVATRFGHLWYLPLIPMGSFVVLEREGKIVSAVPIGLCLKSFFMAWFRTALVILTVGCFCFVLLELLDNKRPKLVDLIVPCSIFLAVALTCAFVSYGKPFRRAKYLRALQLSEKAHFNDAGKIMLEAHFGNITMEEAQSLIETAQAIEAEKQPQAVSA